MHERQWPLLSSCVIVASLFLLPDIRAILILESLFMKTRTAALILIFLTALLSSIAMPSLAQPLAPSVIDPELADRHFRRGNTYNNLERLEDAATEYELAITANPNHLEAIRNLANIYYIQERDDETIALLQRYVVLETEPTTPLVASFNTLAQLLRDNKRFDESIEIDVLAIEHDPENTSQVFIMANTYFNEDLTESAIRVYETALTVNPKDAFLHRSLGRMYEDMGRLEDALTQYKAASELDIGSQFYRDLVNNLEARLAQ